MSPINVFEEARTLAEKGADIRLTSRIVDADLFEVDLWVFSIPGEGRLHTCGRDEVFYVIKGEMELQIDDAVHVLNTGDGAHVKAGIKHKHKGHADTWVLVTSKWPHEHTYYDATS